jgi:hypothetical protein
MLYLEAQEEEEVMLMLLVQEQRIKVMQVV